MKKILLSFLMVVLLTGCSAQSENMRDITIYTSAYPIEYITEQLYADNATIYSIYPTGTNFNEYELTENQIENYSKGNLFVYSGLVQEDEERVEAEYASQMISHNKNLKIIDASKGMEFNNSVEEIWLNPSNMLMMANNVLSGLQEYISDPYLVKEIEENYSELQTSLSALDADFKNLYENATTKKIVVGSDAFKFLEKYSFEVISLEENEDLTSKTISDVETMIKKGEVKYIFVRGDEEANYTIQNLVETTKAKIIGLDFLSSISQVERENKENYLTIMYDNLEELKKELYK